MRIIAFLNSYTEAGISGGELRFIEIAKRMDGDEIIVVTSLMGKRLCESRGLKAKFLVTTREEGFEKVFFMYLKRIFEALSLDLEIQEDDVLYSTSDFPPDLIPALFFRIRHRKGTVLIQIVHHLIPSPVVRKLVIAQTPKFGQCSLDIFV